MKRFFIPFFAFLSYLSFLNSEIKAEVITPSKNYFDYLNHQKIFFIKLNKKNHISLSNNKIASLKEQFNKQLNDKLKKIDNCNILSQNEVQYIKSYSSGGRSWGLTTWSNNTFTVYEYGPVQHDLDYRPGNQACERLGPFKINKVYTSGFYQYEFYYTLEETDWDGTLFEIRAYRKSKKDSMIKSLLLFYVNDRGVVFTSDMYKIAWSFLKPLN